MYGVSYKLIGSDLCSGRYRCCSLNLFISKHYRIISQILNQTVNRYVASKYHYFGVGGGIESFQDFVEKRGVFSVERVFTTDESKFSAYLRLPQFEASDYALASVIAVFSSRAYSDNEQNSHKEFLLFAQTVTQTLKLTKLCTKA